MIRIRRGVGHRVLPHTHPTDENITVIEGVWALARGRRFDAAALELLEPGRFAFIPKATPHFGWSKTETVLQVHGIGPFENHLLDPAYELTEAGVMIRTSFTRLGETAPAEASARFALAWGANVRGEYGEGVVVGATCSSADSFTQYCVETASGAQFWTSDEELRPR